MRGRARGGGGGSGGRLIGGDERAVGPDRDRPYPPGLPEPGSRRVGCELRGRARERSTGRGGPRRDLRARPDRGPGALHRACGLLNVERLLLPIDDSRLSVLCGAIVNLSVLVRDVDAAGVLWLDLERLSISPDDRRFAVYRHFRRVAPKQRPADAERGGSENHADRDQALAGSTFLERPEIVLRGERM